MGDTIDKVRNLLVTEGSPLTITQIAKKLGISREEVQNSIESQVSRIATSQNIQATAYKTM